MSLSSVRAGIKATLDAAVMPGNVALSTIAQTHAYFRFVATEAGRDALLVSGTPPLLHAWMISLADEAPFLTKRSDGAEGRDVGREIGHYKFTLYGYYGVNDAAASELAWQDIVEALINAFRANKKLGLGGVGGFIDATPIQWRQGGHVMMPPGEGGVLCHHARLEITAKEQTEP